MKPDNVTVKLIVIAIIGGACFVASIMVYGLVTEREHRFGDVKQEIASSWGERQVLVGPMLIFEKDAVQKDAPIPPTLYLLPETVRYETELIPEIRSRGIFETVVYVSRVKVSGVFSAQEISKISDPSGCSNQFYTSCSPE